MNARCYIDKGSPFVSVVAETLADGSKAFSLWFRDGTEIPCRTESAADAAFELIVKALKTITSNDFLVL
jgi:L-rhamnose isomerase